jgi:hypothetical protein
MIAITTNSSIKVNASNSRRLFALPLIDFITGVMLDHAPNLLNFRQKKLGLGPRRLRAHLRL